MGDLGSASTAEAQGEATAHVLRCAGINTNLAPVADVPTSTASFMYQRGRTWSFDASMTATLSDAFATGLGAGGNVAVMKHFPGLGFATRQHRRLDGDHHRGDRGTARTRPPPLPGGDRERHPDDHALQRHVHGV